MSKQRKDSRLQCQIMGGKLVISIGINVLAHAFLNGPVGDDLCFVGGIDGWDDSRVKVTSVSEFAAEVRNALLDEAEDGSGPLTNLLDAAYQRVLDDGGFGWWTPDLDEYEPKADAMEREVR